MNILAKNLLILASAGSGKTFQLGNRIIGLVAEGVAPERVVALTFTRKAAGEFADSVLTKLADAAGNDNIADRLQLELGLPAADFKDSLKRVVRALPQLTFGTMDGYFSKIVRAFQYELGLTGGKFELIEGPRAAALADELLAAILGDALGHETGEEFLHAFRRATIGKEEQSVLASLRVFIKRWQGIYQEERGHEWGPARLARAAPEEWAKRKSTLAAAALRGLDAIDYTDKRQRAALEREISTLGQHVIGSGSLGSGVSSLMGSILDAVSNMDGGPLRVKCYKDFSIQGETRAALCEMVTLAAECEMAAALARTRAVREVVALFDDLCGKRFRQRGMLGFNDVKLLMGAWARDEDARLRREAVDFRLDARTDHWLLDEFQDTSRADWAGLQPLIDEAATRDDGSLFIVGDRKQAIYAWRGGDVGLFDEVIARYGRNLDIEPMSESWRSCPQVLELVNRVCGDHETLRELFGEVAERWNWQPHISAPPLTRSEKAGHARVETVGDWEERLLRMEEILREIGIGKRAMTCGILLRGNKQVREVTDFLRAGGFDVIEEGRREPAKDSPVGILICHLLKWLADPADVFSREVVELSPLSGVLRQTYGNAWWKAWETLTEEISRVGFATALDALLAPLAATWSEFGRRRAGDLFAALGQLDSQGGVSLREAASWIESLEVSQSPGIAAVQVMTIHKSKGLGFDVVLLPEVPGEVVPQAQYFDIADGENWLTQTPPKWARAIIPEMKRAEDQWAARQRYEAFCMLYVALTRAKRGLYVLLEPPAKSSATDKPSLSRWLERSVGSYGTVGGVWETGRFTWSSNVSPPAESDSETPDRSLAKAIPKRGQISPSTSNRSPNKKVASPLGIQTGIEVHALLEGIAWIDETTPMLPETPAGKMVSALLNHPNLDPIFKRSGRGIDLLREQAISAMVDDRMVSGVIDRLHLHRNANGRVRHIDIIDYKTDAVESLSELRESHAPQLKAYRNAIAMLHPSATIDCLLLSVRHREIARL